MSERFVTRQVETLSEFGHRVIVNTYTLKDVPCVNLQAGCSFAELTAAQAREVASALADAATYLEAQERKGRVVTAPRFAGSFNDLDGSLVTLTFGAGGIEIARNGEPVGIAGLPQLTVQERLRVAIDEGRTLAEFAESEAALRSRMAVATICPQCFRPLTNHGDDCGTGQAQEAQRFRDEERDNWDSPAQKVGLY